MSDLVVDPSDGSRIFLIDFENRPKKPQLIKEVRAFLSRFAIFLAMSTIPIDRIFQTFFNFDLGGKSKKLFSFLGI